MSFYFPGLILCLLRGPLVGVDDFLHQGMPHHICGGEPADGNILDTLQNPDGILQSGGFVLRQIDLGDVAGDDDF